ncbi:hypothetical protein [Nannocystis punicea]|uniref:Uncharacterized protein n=1 Tax=Nannocystis punicea TaxID=2995304 RepID=A0ABY7H2S6_9BACT|nr:hypothetical protein [Nannocystis poenicansa]WAS93586.1 hypothetical protein O0S08_46225 [Nannocystis poenicansa]
MTDSTPPVRVTEADRTATALVYGLFFAMSAFIALSLYIGANFLAPRVQAPGGPTRGCRDDLADQCAEGEVCEDSVCVPDPRAIDCPEGAPCGACTCIYPMTCGDEQVCRSRPPPPRTCSPRAAEFVEEMLAYQVQCVANAGGQELSSCPTTNVKDFLLSHEKFDALLQEFPNGLVFLFPNGQPVVAGLESEAQQNWPDEATRRFYSAAIADKARSLLAAQHVVIVGRASKGNTATSFAYAQARVRFARNAVLDALTRTPVERGELSKKLIEFALGAERPLTLEFFLLNQLPVVSWNADSRRQLSRVLESARNNVPPGKTDRKAVEDLINRSVAVFAIPPECVAAAGRHPGAP